MTFMIAKQPDEKPETPTPDADRIVDYLRGGRLVLRMAGRVKDDIAKDGSDIPTSYGFLTDGEWLWTTSLIYYVKKYGVEPEQDFVTKIRKLDYICPEVTDDSLADAIAEIRTPHSQTEYTAENENKDGDFFTRANGIASSLLSGDSSVEHEYWEEGDAYRFWQPIRGGASVIVSNDGSYLAAGSSVAPERLKKEFLTGRRTVQEANPFASE